MKGFRAEPVVVERAIRAGIYAAVSLGIVAWTDVQVEAVLLAVVLIVVPIVEVLGGLLLRRNVTSDQTLERAGVTRDHVKAVADSSRGHLVTVGYEEEQDA